MRAREHGALAELGHVGAQVVDPDFPGVALVRLATGEEEHIGLHALGVEDAGGQAQDGVQVALVHQVGADLPAGVALEQHVVRHHHSGAAAGLEGAVDVLQKAELLVAGGEGEVGARRQPAALFGAEGWVGEDECRTLLAERFALLPKRVAVADTGGLRVGIEPVQHQVHQRQPVGVLHVLHTVEGVAPILALLRLGPARRGRCARVGSGWRR